MKAHRYRTATHKVLRIKFEIVGARDCNLGPCFVVRHRDGPRERLFLTTVFDTDDFPTVEREALYTVLLQKEQTRLKAKIKRELGEAKMLHARAFAADEDEADIEPQDVQELQIAEINRDLEELPEDSEAESLEDETEAELAAD
jgi:hypothetical protein